MKTPKNFLIYLLLWSIFPIVKADILLPNIPSTQFLITNYGASTSSTDNSSFINAAISAANAAGGGTVVIPAGTFLSGPITMKSNVNLYLSTGAVLQLMPYGNGNGTPAGSYPNSGAVDSYANFIFGQNLSNIAITGKGAIEGNGTAWWAAYKANTAISRPCMIRFKACNRVLIDSVTLRNAPNVHLTLGQSGSLLGYNGTISNINVSAPSTSPNTDAIDTWYWNGINIFNCNLSTGDDNVALNSYSTNINIKHCTMGTGHGLSVGSYTIGVNNIFADSCTFNGTTNGIRLKTNNTRGGQDSVFMYSNMTMKNVTYPFYITSWYDAEPYPASSQVAGTITATTPFWKNITFKNITVNSTYGGIIYGLPESYIQNVTFDNVKITTTSTGLASNFVNDLKFINCSSITVPSGKGSALNSQTGKTTPAAYAVSSSGINTTSGVSTSCTSALNEVVADESLKCYPNPLSGNDVTVKANDDISKITIFSLAGIKIKEINGYNLTQIPIDLLGIQQGYYVVNVQLNNGFSGSMKLIKEL